VTSFTTFCAIVATDGTRWPPLVKQSEKKRSARNAPKTFSLAAPTESLALQTRSRRSWPSRWSRFLEPAEMYATSCVLSTWTHANTASGDHCRGARACGVCCFFVADDAGSASVPGSSNWSAGSP